jgi:flagellar protein FlaG
MEIKNISTSNIIAQTKNLDNIAGTAERDSKATSGMPFDKKDNTKFEKEINSSVEKANKILFKNNTHLQFKIHKETNDVIIKIIDDETGDILKEIPPEKFVDMIAKITEVAGIFVDEKR